MPENTSIEWADDSVSFWWGCTKIAPGCHACYAKNIADRFGGDIWGGSKPRMMIASASATIRKLNRKAAKEGKRRAVFVNSMSDTFESHDGPIVNRDGERLWQLYPPSGTYVIDTDGHADKKPVTLDDLRRDLFALIDECKWLDFILLTKRPQNVRKMWVGVDGATDVKIADVGKDPQKEWFYRPNVWLLTSISDQATADAMIPPLIECRDWVPVLGVSAEPLLGEVDLTRIILPNGDILDALRGEVCSGKTGCMVDENYHSLDWVIIGGES